MSTTDKTRNIELSVELDASPEDVFRAVTNGTELAKWLAPEARVTPPSEGRGGTIFVSWGEGMGAESAITVWDPPRRMRHTFGENRDSKAPLYVDWSVEAKEGNTSTLRLVHSGFSVSADWDEEFEAHARGWTLMLANLRHYFARHAGAEAAHVIFSAPSKHARDALWQKLLSKDGLDRDGAFASAPPRAGDAYRVTTARGDVLSGKIEIANAARDLALTVSELDDALVRFNFEGGGKGGAFVFGYVIGYGEAMPRARELATSLGKVVEAIAS